jgi:HSP20 family protein
MSKNKLDDAFKDFIDFTKNHWPFTTSSDKPMVNDFTPAIDIYEKDELVQIDIELPGVNKSDVNIALADGLLTISGTTHHIDDDKDIHYIKSERRYGKWNRTITVDRTLKSDEIKAHFENGILNISFPKKAEQVIAEPQKIEII